jgi:hypothetical protein
MQYINLKKAGILTELDEQRKVNLSKANKLYFTIEANTSPSPWQFIGIMTSEDAFEIEPMKGNINKIGLTIVTNMFGDYIDKIQEKYKLGAIFQGSVGLWGQNEELTYNSNKIFMDLQRYNNLSGRNRVSIYTVFARIDGDRNALAKVKIHCMDNLRIKWDDAFICGDYPSPQDRFINSDKSCIKCSKRFNKGRLLNLTSFEEEGSGAAKQMPEEPRPQSEQPAAPKPQAEPVLQPQPQAEPKIATGGNEVTPPSSPEAPSSRALPETTPQPKPATQESLSGQWPWTSERIIRPEDLSQLTLAELELMRNEIYARHGWVFNRQDLQQHFQSQSWYRPKGDKSNREQANRLAQAEMSSIEKKNVQTITAQEKAMKR